MKITAEEARDIARAAVFTNAKETIEKAEPILDRIESDIRGAAAHAMRENHIGLRAYMVNSDFPDMALAKNYIATTVQKNGFSAQWFDYVLFVKW